MEREKKCEVLCFCSRLQKLFICLWSQSFEDAENIHVITLIYAPNFEKILVFGCIGVVEHEFSHATCDAAFLCVSGEF